MKEETKSVAKNPIFLFETCCHGAEAKEEEEEEEEVLMEVAQSEFCLHQPTSFSHSFFSMKRKTFKNKLFHDTITCTSMHCR